MRRPDAERDSIAAEAVVLLNTAAAFVEHGGHFNGMRALGAVGEKLSQDVAWWMKELGRIDREHATGEPRGDQ